MILYRDLQDSDGNGRPYQFFTVGGPIETERTLIWWHWIGDWYGNWCSLNTASNLIRKWLLFGHGDWYGHGDGHGDGHSVNVALVLLYTMGQYWPQGQFIVTTIFWPPTPPVRTYTYLKNVLNDSTIIVRGSSHDLSLARGHIKSYRFYFIHCHSHPYITHLTWISCMKQNCSNATSRKSPVKQPWSLSTANIFIQYWTLVFRRIPHHCSIRWLWLLDPTR